MYALFVCVLAVNVAGWGEGEINVATVFYLKYMFRFSNGRLVERAREIGRICN